jgi:hypothetical protein
MFVLTQYLARAIPGTFGTEPLVTFAAIVTPCFPFKPPLVNPFAIAYAHPFCKVFVVGVDTVVGQTVADWQPKLGPLDPVDPQVYEPPVLITSTAACAAASAADSAAVWRLVS